MHVALSGCADERVPDDETALARIRAEVAKLPGLAADYYRHGAEPGAPSASPRRAMHDIAALAREYG